MAEFVVTTLADTVANDGQLSLREALAQVPTTGSHKISFAESLNGTINLSTHLTIAAGLGGKAVTVDGDFNNDGVSEIVLDGGANATHHVEIGAGAVVTLDTLVFRNGRADAAVGAVGSSGPNGINGEDATFGSGNSGTSGSPGTIAGGNAQPGEHAASSILNKGNLTLRGVTFQTNTSFGGDGGQGGSGASGGRGGHGSGGVDPSEPGEPGIAPGSGGSGANGTSGGNGGSGGAGAVIVNVQTGKLTLIDSTFIQNANNAGHGGAGGIAGSGGDGGDGGNATGGTSFAGGVGGSAGSGGNGGSGGQGGAAGTIVNFGQVVLASNYISSDNDSNAGIGGLGAAGGSRGIGGGSGNNGGQHPNPGGNPPGMSGADGSAGANGAVGPAIDFLLNLAGAGAVSGGGTAVTSVFGGMSRAPSSPRATPAQMALANSPSPSGAPAICKWRKMSPGSSTNRRRRKSISIPRYRRAGH